MTTNDLHTIATHPTVQFCISNPFERWAFARFYHTLQARSPELLSLLDTIECWRCTPFGALGKEMSNFSQPNNNQPSPFMSV